ncbi:hypothetical protein D2V93_06965 [Flagellimonas taeanensis]|uniref:hypothetical protein n=1 Tax=Flavobacteriaceae TaxID=49546 RepID=UPI000E68AF01|nr:MULTISPECIES: hypothetical protein [Allomuricauda]MDC6384613.1 hypothetical protein [Muricauda sp. SK9]RIV51639.1 hypothetical protein D2V93_06965 [Allomuricauda taeanensis]
MLALQTLTFAGCGIMAFQDFKDREVTWVLFPILGLLMALLHLFHVEMTLFFVSVLGNVVVVSGILLILWAVTKYIFKKVFLNVSFGLGDVLFFYALALGFPTITFIYLLVGSICFSFVAFFLLNRFIKMKTVPLAGLMGIFLMAVTLLTLFPNTPSLYVI